MESEHHGAETKILSITELKVLGTGRVNVDNKRNVIRHLTESNHVKEIR